MAKKLSWSSNFTIQDLRVDNDDDIYASFPFLVLVGMSMLHKTELTATTNLVRGIKDTVTQKLVGLQGSLFYGWDRTSWPIPWMLINGVKRIFDRRHTLKSCNANRVIEEVPTAQYERAYPNCGKFINDFLDESILVIAAMWGNVHGPIVEDTKDHMYVTAISHILEVEKERDIFVDFELVTRDNIKFILKWMGCYVRYNSQEVVINRIVTQIMDVLEDPESVANKVSHDFNEEDVLNFVAKSDDWFKHCTSDGKLVDSTVYLLKAIEDSKSFLRRYADDIIRKACENQKDENATKVLLYNKANKQSKKIANSRKLFKQYLNESWVLRRDNVLEPLSSINGGPVGENYMIRKKLSDLNIEIWVKDQIEGEEEPFPMNFDLED
mgnify:CR=1 FL=1|tara:strand:+ start:2731 stop:3876 length:1146 start_codon:yes stop_codon:yes gene_type:complete